MELRKFEIQRKVGQITINLPEPPNKDKIFGYDLVTSKQKFYRPEIPNGNSFHLLPKDEQMAFFKQEMDRRRNGFWFWNNGQIEYITGLNYFFLSYWWLGDKYADFIDAQRDVFYFWDACVKSPDCYGGFVVSGRRFGKTSIGTAILYDDVSTNFNHYGGIQSITERAGKEVFRKLITSWRKLHPIWKPTDSGETNPKTALRFEEPSKRGTKNQHKIYKDVLDSWIDYRHAEKEAYDGQKIHRMYNDEVAKTKDIDVYDRWITQRPCLIDRHEDIPIIGKAFYTTTIEPPSSETKLSRETTKRTKVLWDDCDVSTMYDEFGKQIRKNTKSGMFKMFVPAWYGRIYNEYGYSDIEAGKQDILNDREGKTGKELYAIMRKDPMDEKEAWIISDEEDVFPAHKIHQQMLYNEKFCKGTVRKGNFIMVEPGRVEFYDDPRGRWEVSMLPKEEMRNKIVFDGGRPAPGNPKFGCMGVDPYDHKTTSGERKSDGSASLFRNFSSEEMYASNCFIAFYLHRPEDPIIFYDDILNACVFYGIQFLSEKQNAGIFNHFRSKGYGAYIMHTRIGEFSNEPGRGYVEGLPTTGDGVRTELVNGLISYINDYVGQLSPKAQVEMGISQFNESIHGNCPFERMLDDWSIFKYSKWTDYDASVSSMIGLAGAKRLVKVRKSWNDEAVTKPIIEFPTFKI